MRKKKVEDVDVRTFIKRVEQGFGSAFYSILTAARADYGKPFMAAFEERFLAVCREKGLNVTAAATAVSNTRAQTTPSPALFLVCGEFPSPWSNIYQPPNHKFVCDWMGVTEEDFPVLPEGDLYDLYNEGLKELKVLFDTAAGIHHTIIDQIVLHDEEKPPAITDKVFFNKHLPLLLYHYPLLRGIVPQAFKVYNKNYKRRPANPWAVLPTWRMNALLTQACAMNAISIAETEW